jgi:hypothetical protein
MRILVSHFKRIRLILVESALKKDAGYKGKEFRNTWKKV